MTTQELDTKYKELKQKADDARSHVIFGVLDALRYSPDELRKALGSVTFRKVEEYKAYDEQAEAAFLDWLGSLGA